MGDGHSVGCKVHLQQIHTSQQPGLAHLRHAHMHLLSAPTTTSTCHWPTRFTATLLSINTRSIICQAITMHKQSNTPSSQIHTLMMWTQSPTNRPQHIPSSNGFLPVEQDSKNHQEEFSSAPCQVQRGGQRGYQWGPCRWPGTVQRSQHMRAWRGGRS